MSEIEKTKTGKPMGDHEIGYARPPEKSKWKKGQSGNPKGRSRKQEREVQDMVRDAIRREIPVREGDQTRSAPYMELFFMDWANKALKGTPKEKKDFYKALQENFADALEPIEPEPVEMESQVKPLRLIYPEEPKRSQENPTTPSAPTPGSSHGAKS